MAEDFLYEIFMELLCSRTESKIPRPQGPGEPCAGIDSNLRAAAFSAEKFGVQAGVGDLLPAGQQVGGIAQLHAFEEQLALFPLFGDEGGDRRGRHEEILPQHKGRHPGQIGHQQHAQAEMAEQGDGKLALYVWEKCSEIVQFTA